MTTTPTTRRRRRRPVVATEPAPGRTALTIPETAWLLNCSPNHVWNLIADDKVKSFRLGRKRLVARAELEAFIAGGGTGDPAA